MTMTLIFSPFFKGGTFLQFSRFGSFTEKLIALQDSQIRFVQNLNCAQHQKAYTNNQRT